MKTIFITISRGGTARNILQTDIFKILKESGNKIVILTPAYKDQRFIDEFGGPNIYFEDLIEHKWTLLDRILVGLHKALIYNHSVELWDKHGIFKAEEGKFWRYTLKKIIFLPLSRIKILREFVRWIDKVFIVDKHYNEIFDKYKPDLIFTTSIMENYDVFVLKQAKQRGVKTIGMAKSWDNTSKMSFRVKTDKIIVWSDYVRDESLEFQGYKKEEIIVCGVPQFDFYFQDKFKMEREEFFQSIGADSNKKLIVFGSEGKLSFGDGEITEIIHDALLKNDIKTSSQIFIRPHFMYLDDEKKFEKLKDKENVILDQSYKRSLVFRDNWDYSIRQITHFANLIRYADIVITTASTLILDAASLDKPVINVNFDGAWERPFKESIRKWYLSEYMRAVLRQNGSSLVNSKEELISAINTYLETPNEKSEGRNKLRQYFCYKMDGKSAERVANAVLSEL